MNVTQPYVDWITGFIFKKLELIQADKFTPFNNQEHSSKVKGQGCLKTIYPFQKAGFNTS